MCSEPKIMMIWHVSWFSSAVATADTSIISRTKQDRAMHYKTKCVQNLKLWWFDMSADFHQLLQQLTHLLYQEQSKIDLCTIRPNVFKTQNYDDLTCQLIFISCCNRWNYSTAHIISRTKQFRAKYYETKTGNLLKAH